MRQKSVNLLFLANHILLIIYMSWLTKSGIQLQIESVTPLLLVSLFLTDISYISSCNIRSNKIISLFCGLLALNCWYMLLLLDSIGIAYFAFTALNPVMMYLSVKFILLFLFQGSGYKFQNLLNSILLIACVSTLIGLSISDRAFASMYGIQFLVNFVCLLFIAIYHRKRILFALKSEWIHIAISAFIVTLSFFAYYLATKDIANNISNFGIYLPTLLFSISVHGIVLKEHSSFPLSTVFSKSQIIMILCSVMVLSGVVILLSGGSYAEMLIAFNVLFVAVYICNIVLEHNLKTGRDNIAQKSKYNATLQQLQQEEILKAKFANFLHDDILQDLLAIKNMMSKAHRSDIQDMIIETLNGLNTHIRQQMQDYHPIILKSLTAKENYQNLIEAVSQSFPQKRIDVSFECSDTLFLVEPYDVLIYRLLKELLTNVYKHSDGNQSWILLSQEEGIIELSVSDNGTAEADSLTSIDETKHKGISSITEQINRMNGSVTISDNIPNGICIKIMLPMKGDVSYQYFVS